MGKEVWKSTGSVGLSKYLFPFVKMGCYDFLFLNFMIEHSLRTSFFSEM